MRERNSSVRSLLLLCYIFFSLIGFVLGMRTSIFYYVQDAYLDSYSPIANMILISGICMQVSLYLSGRFMKKIGYKKLLNIGMGAFTVPILCMFLVDSFSDFMVIYTLLMFAYGIAVIILNLYVGVLEPRKKASNLMTLHLFFCLGALMGPKLISVLTDLTISWQLVTCLTGIPLLLVFLVTLKANAPDVELISRSGEFVDVSSRETYGYTSILIVVFMCSQVWEYGIGTWFVMFVSQSGRYTIGDAALYLTLFYLTYPVVRVVLAKIIGRFDLLKLTFISFLYAAICGLIGALTGQLIFFSLTGIGVATIYPALMAYMQDALGSDADRKIGFISMVGGLIQYVAIWSVGLISDAYGIVLGFNSLVIYLFIGAVGVVLIRHLHSGLVVETV